MCRAASQPRGAAIALRSRLLWHEVVITTSSQAVTDALAYMTQGAEHSFSARRTMTYDVADAPDGFAISEEGDALAAVPDARAVLDQVYRRVHQRAFELGSLLGWVRVHGALATIGDRRVLAVGPSGVGKTTLSLRLLFSGTPVHGDESVMLQNGRAVAVARPFHLKPGIVSLVPEVSGLFDALPSLDGDPVIRAFDPSLAGFTWTIDDAPVDDVVVLERSADGRSTLEPVRATEAMPFIVEEVFRNQEPTRAVLAEVAAVLRSAACWRLRLGDPAEAARSLHATGGLG